MSKLTYLKLKKLSGLKKGDCVLIVCKTSSYSDGWNNEWTKEMNEYIGDHGIIKEDFGSRGFLISGWVFPYFVLVKIENKYITNAIKIER